nr:uncharacterized protein LOC129164909 [Nothobranchius furzeri]
MSKSCKVCVLTSMLQSAELILMRASACASLHKTEQLLSPVGVISSEAHPFLTSMHIWLPAPIETELDSRKGDREIPEPATDFDVSWESLRPGAKGKGRGKGCSEGRGRTRSRGEGSRLRSRAPSRRPGCRGRQRTAFREEDRDRLAQLRAASIAEMQTALQHLSQEERDYILERVVTRLPGVMLDILEFRQDTPGHHLPD